MPDKNDQRHAQRRADAARAHRSLEDGRIEAYLVQRTKSGRIYVHEYVSPSHGNRAPAMNGVSGNSGQQAA